MRRAAAVGMIALAAALPCTAPAQALDTSTTSFKVGNLEVIHRRLTNTEIVVAQLYFLGGTRQVTFEDAGIEPLLLRSTGNGTKKYPGQQAALALARTGSTITVSAGADWSTMELRTVRSELDSAWSVFADRVVAPELSATGVTLVRDRMYIDAVLRVSNPDALAQRFADSLAFHGHPYAIQPWGSEKSLAAIKLADVKAYHGAEMVTSRMLLVFVGNTTRADIERLVKGTLATLPDGQYVWALPPDLPMREASLRIIHRKLPTNYILGLFPGPPVGDRDHASFRVATALLGGNISYIIREQQQLSYAAYAPFLDRAIAAGGVYVTTSKPELVMRNVIELMSMSANMEMDWKYVPRLISQWSIDYLAQHETYADQGIALAEAHLLRGNFRNTEAWLKDLKGVAPIRLKLMARTYFPKIQYVYVGDTAVFRAFMKRP